MAVITPKNVKTSKVREGLLDEELALKINGKMDKTEALDSFRRKVTPISEDDLNTALRMKIQQAAAGGGGGGSVGDGSGGGFYDDSEMRVRLADLEEGRVKKEEMINYFRKDETIHEANISPTYRQSVQAALNDKDTKIHNMDLVKVDKTDLVNYRKVVDKITELDLSKTLYDRIIAGVGGGSGGGDSAAVIAMIDNLNLIKADKTQLDLLRKLADPIGMSDVSSELAEALSKAALAAAAVANKADKSEIELLRRLDVPLKLSDMDAKLAGDLSLALNASTDIEAFVKEYMAGVKNEMAVDIANAYGQQDQLDFPFQWEITMYHYTGHEGHYTVFWALNILYRELKQLIGRAQDGGGPAIAGRVPALETKMTAAEGSIASVRTRTTAAEQEITSLKSKVSSLESDVATLKNEIKVLQEAIAGVL